MPHAPNTFVHLHNHTEYSLLDRASRIHPLVEAAAKLEMPALAITDHGVMYGAIHFYKACKEAGIKPIVGCEVYVAPRSRLLREGRVDRDPSHLTLLAASHEGYLNLMKLCTVGQMEGMYYKPRIDKEILAEHSAGLIALSGCLQGEIAGRIVDNDLEGAKESAAAFADMCDLKLHLGATLLPPFDVPDGLSPDQYLAKLVADGLKWRYGTEPSSAAKDRAANELEVIKATGYASYFLIVWDFYNFARKHEIVVGPGRGSAAGSLAAYAFGTPTPAQTSTGPLFRPSLTTHGVPIPTNDPS